MGSNAPIRTESATAPLAEYLVKFSSLTLIVTFGLHLDLARSWRFFNPFFALDFTFLAHLIGARGRPG
jgi:hypothetical protein